MDRTLRISTEYEDISVLCECLLKGNFSREGFYYQVDKMAHSVDIS